MNSASRMVHRATLERDATAGTDDPDNPGYSAAPAYGDHLPDLRARWWIDTRVQSEAPEGARIVGSHRMIVPLGTDVRETDRVTEVRDTRGRVLWPTAPGDGQSLTVRTVLPRTGAHILLTLSEAR